MPGGQKRLGAGKRVRPTDATWTAVLERAGYACEWNEAGMVCGLKDGENDPVGGGRVKLTPDHKNPHSLNPDADPNTQEQWQALWSTSSHEEKLLEHNYRQAQHVRHRPVCSGSGEKGGISVPSVLLRVYHAEGWGYQEGREMKNNGDRMQRLLEETRDKIQAALAADGIVILPPMDVHVSARLLDLLGIKAQTTIFDPWYNKGVGGERDDYIQYVVNVLKSLKPFSEHLFFWGFPEIIAHFVDKIPEPLVLRCWVTWFYKNSPSMIRGWRSAQMTCLHLSKPDAKMHVENFLNEVQLQKLKQGKLRFIPGPASVIEESLLCGFVGRNEQTGTRLKSPSLLSRESS